MKRIKILLIAALMLAALPPQALAEALPLQKTELVNVAEGKPVTSRDVHLVPQYVLPKLVDGERDTFILSECGAEAAASEWITVDLLRRCKIEKIELFDRYDHDVATGRQYIEIIGAKNADFSDAVVLGKLDALDDEAFPHGGRWTVNLDGNKAYRYIKLQRTGGGDYQYAELKVWAQQSVTEVSRGADAIADNLADTNHWIYDFAPLENALDGESSTLWLEDGEAYRFLRVDLGSAYNIGMIEMAGRDFTVDDRIDNEWARKYISIYGNNDESTENNMFDPFYEITEEEAATLGFTRLAGVGANTTVESEVAFPAVHVPAGMEVTYGEKGKFQSTCDDTNAVRYITYRAVKQSGAALTTFAAYVINPTTIGGVTDGKSIEIEFSDEMDFTEVIADSSKVKVYVDGTEKAVAVSEKDAYTLMLELDKTYFDSKIKVELPKDIKNLKNTAMQENAVIDLIAPSAVNIDEFKIQDSMTVDSSEIPSLENVTEVGVKIKLTNYMTDKSETAVVLMVMYDENNTMIGANEKRITLAPKGTPEAEAEEPVIFGLEKAESARKVTVYVWRDYDLMKPYLAKTSIN